MINWLLNKFGYYKSKKICIFTIGNDTYPATPRQLKLLQKAINRSKDGEDLVWNHTLRSETIELSEFKIEVTEEETGKDD